MALSHRSRQAIDRPVEGYDEETTAEDQERAKDNPPSQRTDTGENHPRPQEDAGGDRSTPPEADGNPPRGLAEAGNPQPADRPNGQGAERGGGGGAPARASFPNPETQIVRGYE